MYARLLSAGLAAGQTKGSVLPFIRAMPDFTQPDFTQPDFTQPDFTQPDFTFQPGQDGALPDGVPEWRDGVGELMTRGLIYTARDARSVLPSDQKYRITTIFKQKVAKDAPLTGYSYVYRRVVGLAAARAAEMSCAHGEPLHSRIAGHMWTSIPGGSSNFPMAALVTELSCPRAASADGEPQPTPGALLTPGGTPPEEFSRICSEASQEIYNEYDVGEGPGANAEPISFSYGEHVETCAGIDYARFVERAENRARAYYHVLAGFGAGKLTFAILRRHWFAASDNLAVVVVYFRA